MRIGFIGLGIMGQPMARNLMKAGHSLLVHNRSRPAVDKLVNEGAEAGIDPRDVAACSDVVITMLPDSPDVEAVVLGANGVLEGARDRLYLIDMSTISPVASKRIAEEASRRGVRALDAPVSGGEKGAIAATLSIMVGGSKEAFDHCRPILDALGKTVTYCGASGAGQIVKACNQVVVALVIEAVSEALVLGSKAGVEPSVILEVLGGGLAQNRVMDLRGSSMIEHQFAPGFKARLHRKDMGIILDVAREFGVALPVSALVNQMFTTLVERGDGELDHSALLTIVENLSNHSIKGAGMKEPAGRMS
jgi:2-hydroxy-3-oxopropionate reductase